MHSVRILSAAALAAAAFLTTSADAPVPAGPGTVIEAIRSFADVAATGDAKAIRATLAAPPGAGEFGWCAGENGGKFGEVPDSVAVRFVDVDEQGRPVSHATEEDFAAWLAKGSKADSVTISAIRADCPDGGCAWAIVDLERVRGSGDDARRQPLRATALLRWVGGEGEQWRVFHWHVSAVAENDSVESR